MSFIKMLEEYDATHGIPRPADAQHIPPYQAFLKCVTTGLLMLVLTCCGIISAYCLWLAAGYLRVSGQVRLYFMLGMMTTILVGLMEALQEVMPYYRFKQRLTFGTARWADELYLKNTGLALKVGTDLSELPRGAIRIGKMRKGYDLVLPVGEWLRHAVIFGPPGSGKSKTFLMNIIRDVARGGSAVVLDPKGELFEQTAHHFHRVYRLDLVNPKRSDRWNFVPRCKGKREFANQMAATMIGLEGTKHSVADPFWQEAELLLLTAILLHLPDIVDEPTPPMAYEYAAMRDMKSIETEMGNSTNSAVRLAWGAFQKAPAQTQGSVVTGLMNKLQSFQIENAQAVCAPVSEADRAAGVRLIDFSQLRKPGTVIYVVIAEGDATRYKNFLSTFIGQAVNELRVDDHGENAAPVMFVLDEAANVPLVGLKEIAGVGRGRKIGLLMGYQNLPQVQDQYGHDGANAILGSIGAMLFLPGLDDATAQYASRRIGQTTVWSHTTVDDPRNRKNDNERQSETGRALMDPTELRQMIKHKQYVVVIDTSPPIKAAYPPFAVRRARAIPNEYGEPKIVSLVEAEEEHLRKLALKMGAQEAAEGAQALDEQEGKKEEEDGNAGSGACPAEPVVNPRDGGSAQIGLLPETIDGGVDYTEQAPSAVAKSGKGSMGDGVVSQHTASEGGAPAAEAAATGRETVQAGSGDHRMTQAVPPENTKATDLRVRGSVNNVKKTQNGAGAPLNPNQRPLFYSDQGVEGELLSQVGAVLGRQRVTVRVNTVPPAVDGGVEETVPDDAILNRGRNGSGEHQDGLR